MQLHLVPPKADKVQSMRETTVCQSSTEGKLLPLSAARPGPLQSAGLPILVADAEVVTVAVPPSAASFLLSFPSCA